MRRREITPPRYLSVPITNWALNFKCLKIIIKSFTAQNLALKTVRRRAPEWLESVKNLTLFF